MVGDGEAGGLHALGEFAFEDGVEGLLDLGVGIFHATPGVVEAAELDFAKAEGVDFLDQAIEFCGEGGAGFAPVFCEEFDVGAGGLEGAVVDLDFANGGEADVGLEAGGAQFVFVVIGDDGKEECSENQQEGEAGEQGDGFKFYAWVWHGVGWVIGRRWSFLGRVDFGSVGGSRILWRGWNRL